MMVFHSVRVDQIFWVTRLPKITQTQNKGKNGSYKTY